MTKTTRVSLQTSLLMSVASAAVAAAFVALLSGGSEIVKPPPFAPPPDAEVGVDDDDPDQPHVITDIGSLDDLPKVSLLAKLAATDARLTTGALAWTRKTDGAVVRHSDLVAFEPKVGKNDYLVANDHVLGEGGDHARGAALIWMSWDEDDQHFHRLLVRHDSGVWGGHGLVIGDLRKRTDGTLVIPLSSYLQQLGKAGGERYGFESALSWSGSLPQGLQSMAVVSWQQESERKAVVVTIAPDVAAKLTPAEASSTTTTSYLFSAEIELDVPVAIDTGTPLSINVVCWGSHRSDSDDSYEFMDLKPVVATLFATMP